MPDWKIKQYRDYIGKNEDTINILSKHQNWITTSPLTNDRRHPFEKQKTSNIGTSKIMPKWMELKFKNMKREENLKSTEYYPIRQKCKKQMVFVDKELNPKKIKVIDYDKNKSIFSYGDFRNNVVTYSTGNDEEIFWMKRALQVGKKGMIENDELPIGVVLVAGNRLLTETCTLTYTLNSPITHGDFMALFNAEREVYSPNIERPLVLYSSLEPHLLGFGAAIKCKVDKVVFGLEAIPDGGSCYLKNMVGIKERIPKVVGGVLREEQYKLMKEFLETHEENRVGYGYAKSLVKLYEKGR